MWHHARELSPPVPRPSSCPLAVLTVQEPSFRVRVPLTCRRPASSADASIDETVVDSPIDGCIDDKQVNRRSKRQSSHESARLLSHIATRHLSSESKRAIEIANQQERSLTPLDENARKHRSMRTLEKTPIKESAQKHQLRRALEKIPIDENTRKQPSMKAIEDTD